MVLPESQTAEVKKLLDDGRDAHEVAESLGVPFRTVVAIKAAQARIRNLERSESETLVDEAIEQTFALESDMQDALRSNIEQLEAGLEIVDDGKEKKVPSGFIDITAEDKQGATVVIELKAGTAEHKAIAQVLSYMGDLVSEAKQVRGILVAGGFTDRAISAARAVPNLSLRKYAFKFSFQAIK
jgi:RecB family endonuclease NucS